nr:cell wall hydrolase [Sphingomonas jinjuensis]
MGAIALGAVAVPTWVVLHPPALAAARKIAIKLPKRIVPQAELPPVEPVRFVDLSSDDAREYNASVPFSDAPNPAARPFRFSGPTDARARAVDCLAAAVLYEAGDDAKGERAVAQVVLNRLRHPAFPKTVCGVVFEGAERSTGCQFTFTCDGALTRWSPPDAGWRRAREIAEMALSGSVFRPVGYSTHYHTDWVVPYWQSSLDKVVKVGSHLFFRWAGWWGTPPAFGRTVSGDEPSIAKLAAVSDAHRLGAALDEAAVATTDAATAATTGTPASVEADPNSFLVVLPRGVAPETYPALAQQACGERTYCKFSAWIDPAKRPATLPLNAADIASMTFSYLRDRVGGYEKPLWNCQQVKRAPPGQCMKTQMLGTAPQPANAVTIEPLRGPGELPGVRRRPVPAPTPSPTPSPVGGDYR